MRNLTTLTMLAASALAGTMAVADEATFTQRNVRITAELDADFEIEEVVVETRTTDGWQVDFVESAEANEVLAEADTLALAAGADCNANGIDDASEISAGAPDINANGQLDACERARGDVNLSGSVNVYDVYFVLGLRDSPYNSAGDVDGDGFITGADISLILLAYGT